jgi:hypothetical protein
MDYSEKRADSGERIALHRIGFPAILPRCVINAVGDKQRTSINDVEHNKHAQLTLVWIEASECLYRDMRKGAYEKCNAYAPLNFAQQEIKYVQ